MSYKISILKLEVNDNIKDPLKKGQFLEIVEIPEQPFIITVKDSSGDIFPIYRHTGEKVFKV